MKNKFVMALIPLGIILFLGYFIYQDYSSYQPYLYYVIPVILSSIGIHYLFNKISTNMAKTVDKTIGGIVMIYISILTTQGKLSTFFDNENVLGIIGNVLINNILSILIFITFGTIISLIVTTSKILLNNTDVKGE